VRAWVLAVTVAVAVGSTGGCGSQRAAPSAASGFEQLRRALVRAEEAGSFRVEGTVTVGAPLVRWQGVVSGTTEQDFTWAAGLTIESQRADGQGWVRRTDISDDWRRFPYDGPVDLGVLLHGHVEDVQHDDTWSVTVSFHDVDVLKAMTHIPSIGDTEVTVTLGNGELVRADLDVGGHAHAELLFSDYGVGLALDPVPMWPAAPVIEVVSRRR
jgi:hypothetical protein